MNTEEDNADIKAFCRRLRADLSATNTLLFAMFGAMPKDQREKVLPALAAKMAAREQLAGRSVPPEILQAMEEVESAVERLWDDLTEIHRLT